MNFNPPTERQRELLNQMLYHVMVEIRILCWGGHMEQAAALADAFHNLPCVMYSEQFSFPQFRCELESYQNRYPPPEYQRGPNYIEMLDKVLHEEELRPKTK